MTHFAVVTPTPRNRLLRALPLKDLATLWPQLEPFKLTMGQTLHFPEQPMPAVYFIESGLISKFATIEDGDTAEVGLVGYEGMLGLPLLTDEFDDLKSMVQCPGTALRLSVEAFRTALEQLPGLRRLVDHYTLWVLMVRWRKARPAMAAITLPESWRTTWAGPQAVGI